MTALEEFQLEQYKSLRIEINNNIAEIRALQRFAVIGVVAVWAWVAVNAASAPRWAAFTPLVFVVLGALHSRRVLREMGQQGDYIAMVIEPAFCGDQSVKQSGWENWIRRRPEGERGFRKAGPKPLADSSVQVAPLHNPGASSAPISVEWIVLAVLILLVGAAEASHPHVTPEPKSTVVCCASSHC